MWLRERLGCVGKEKLGFGLRHGIGWRFRPRHSKHLGPDVFRRSVATTGDCIKQTTNQSRCIDQLIPPVTVWFC